MQDATQKILEAAEALERRQQLREQNLAPVRPGAAERAGVLRAGPLAVSLPHSARATHTCGDTQPVNE